MGTPSGSHHKRAHTFFGLTRIALGLTLLWAFFDKVFGLGYATAPDKAWLEGVSPAGGFLEFGTAGPFAGIFQAMAGNPLVDWLFMLGLLGIGLALTLGIATRIASYCGALLMLLLWLAVLPPEHHPVLDEHIVYLLVLLAFTSAPAGEWLGLGKWWSALPFVKKAQWLK